MGTDRNEVKNGKRSTRSGQAKNADVLAAPSRGATWGGPGEERDTTAFALYDLLSWYSCRIDGYVRIIPDGDQKMVHLKYKFTRDQFEGHYAYVSGNAYDVPFLLWKLRDQIEDIYAGVRRPAKDRPYDEK